MDVHRMGPGQEIGKVLKPDHTGDGDPYRRPEGIPPANPIPYPEPVFRWNPKFYNLFFIFGDSDKMVPNRSLFFNQVEKPSPCCSGIRHGFLGCEGFGGDEEEGRFRRDFFERLSDMGPVHV